MRSLLTLTAVVVAAATMATASAPVAGATVRPAGASAAAAQHHLRAARSTAEALRDARHGVAFFRQKTWHVQRRIPVPLTPTNYAERHTRSVAYAHWLKHLWHGRWHRALHSLAAHRLPFTNDWETAVRIVQRVWPGTSGWLLSCSAHEGGHGAFVMNTQGSGAGGWMQFMSGTFSWALGRAKAAAPRIILRPGTAAWTSPLGQAFAAGWARVAYLSGELARERIGWPWTGDPYCA